MSEPVQRNTVARRVGEIAQAGDTALGVAVSAAGSATVRGGGLSAVAEPRGSAAVGVIDLEQRADRWWGRLARGVAGRAGSRWEPFRRMQIFPEVWRDDLSRPNMLTFTVLFRNPLSVAASFSLGTYGGSVSVAAITLPNATLEPVIAYRGGLPQSAVVAMASELGVRWELVNRGWTQEARDEMILRWSQSNPGLQEQLRQNTDEGFELEGRLPRVEAGGFVVCNIRGWGQRRPQDGPPVYTWFNEWTALEPDPGPPLDWRPAARALVPVATGLGWWGAIEAAARSGQWVRRASWVSGRRLRFEAGLGTTRAVARHELAGVVTTVDSTTFGAAEFVAEDWLIEGEAIPLSDVTDVVLEGPVVFAISAAAVEPPGGDGGDGGGDGGGGGNVTFPPTGEGVPYVRGGQVVRLLPIKDGGGAVWRP